MSSLPDEYLASTAARETGKHIVFPSRDGSGDANLLDVQMIGWRGRCEVHERFTVGDVVAARAQFPGVLVLAHPECSPEVVAAADFSASTTAMARRAAASDAPYYLLLTECSMGDNIAAANPAKEMLRYCSIRCPHMNEITLEDTLASLRNDRWRIEVPEPVRTRAARALVLEIGCGTAWNLVRVAKRYPGAEVFGIDVSNAMLDTARSSVKRHGLAGKIHFAKADATAFSGRQSFGVSELDRVFFSYALSMIPGWRDALSAGLAHLAPGGRMHIVDFGQCEKLPNSFKMVFFNFLGHYSVTPRADLEQVCMRVCEEQSLSLSFRRLHRGYTDYAVLNQSTR